MIINQKQKILIIVAIIVLVLVVIGGAVYFLLNKNKQVACTMETRTCSDGTSVGRTGPNCEFAACPEIKIINTGKENLSDAEKKLSSDLLELIKSKTAGTIYVYIYFNSSAKTTVIDPIVPEVVVRDEKNHLINAWINVDKLIEIASLDGVKSIQTSAAE